MYDYEIKDEDYILSVRVLRKELKDKLDIYLGKKEAFIYKGKDLKFNHFMSEFIIHPLNFDF